MNVEQDPGNADQGTGGPTVRVVGWQWGPDESRRPDLPWIGIFLVVFGALLIVQNALPEYRSLGNTGVLAAGLAFLLVWLLRRGTVALYLGAFLTAASLPGTLQGLGYELGTGWGTMFFGVALLFIALVRAGGRGGWGWQAIGGAVLVLLASSEIAVPSVGNLVLPALLVVLGVILLVRGRR
ncbi:MAG: hypothetical protein HW391_1823 [Chloroflexi bacterium]|nr:hypothetical protein [Chloroflexota bacterium]